MRNRVVHDGDANVLHRTGSGGRKRAYREFSEDVGTPGHGFLEAGGLDLLFRRKNSQQSFRAVWLNSDARGSVRDEDSATNSKAATYHRRVRPATPLWIDVL